MMQLIEKTTSTGSTFYVINLLGNAGNVVIVPCNTPNSWGYSWNEESGFVEATTKEEARTLILRKITGLK